MMGNEMGNKAPKTQPTSKEKRGLFDFILKRKSPKSGGQPPSGGQTTVQTPPPPNRDVPDPQPTKTTPKTGDGKPEPVVDKTPPPGKRLERRQGQQDLSQVPQDPDVLQAARQKWETALGIARKGLSGVIDRPLIDSNEPVRIIKRAEQVANGGNQKNYEDATGILHDEFAKALQRAVQGGEALERVQSKAYDELRELEKEVSDLVGGANVIDPRVVHSLAEQARSKLEEAKTEREFQAVRGLVKQGRAKAKVFKAVKVKQGVGEDVKQQLTEEDKAKVEQTEAAWAWEAAHKAADEKLSELKKLGEFCPLTEPDRLLHEAEAEAAKGTTEAYQAATTLLSARFDTAVETARKAATEANEIRSAANNAVHAAERGRSKVEDLSDYIDPSPVAVLVDQARVALNSATTPEDFKKVMPLAKSAQDKIDELLQAARPAQQAEKAYEKALTAAQDAASEVARLPMADTFAPISKALEHIRASITEAQNTVAVKPPTPKTAGLLNTGTAKLNKVAEERQAALDAAKAAAEVLRKLQEAEASLAELKKYKFIDTAPVEALLARARQASAKVTDPMSAKEVESVLEEVRPAIVQAQENSSGEIELVRTAQEEEGKARAVLASLEALPNAQTYGPLRKLLEDVRRSITSAHETVDQAPGAEALNSAIATFQGVSAWRGPAKQLSTEAGNHFTLLTKCNQLVAEQERHAFLDAKELRQTLDRAGNLLQAAVTSEGARLALAPLATLPKEIEKLRKPHGDALKARVEYDKLRKLAGDTLAGVVKLRGAGKDDEMDRLIQNMQDTLDQADQAASTAKTKEDLKKASLKFATLKRGKEEAEARARKLKEEFEGDREARKHFDKVLVAAEKAAAEAAGLPGASKKAEDIRTLIAQARASIVRDGELDRGHAKALALLQKSDTGYAKLLEKAKEEAAAFKPSPEVAQKRQEVEAKISLLDGVAPVDTVALFKSELATALEKSLEDAKGALGKLERIASEAVAVASRLGTEQKESRKKLTELVNLMAVIHDYAPSETIARLERVTKRVVSVDFPALEWVAADTRLKVCLAEAQEWSDLKPVYEQWTRKDPELVNMEARCKAIADGWPPLKGPARKVEGAIRSLKPEIKKTGHFQHGLDALVELAKEFQKLEDDTKAQTPKQPNGETVDLEALAAARKEASALVARTNGELDAAFREFEKLPEMDGLKHKDKIPVYRQRQKIVDDWAAFVGGGSDQGATGVDAIRTRAADTVTKLKALEPRLKALLSDKMLMAQELREAVRAHGEESEKERPARIEAMLAELGRHKVDVSKIKARFEKALKLGPNEQRIELVDIEGTLKTQLPAARAKFEKTRQKAVKQAKAFRKTVIPYLQKGEFKEFYKKLRDRTNDADTLLESGDEDLIRQGMAELEAMRKSLLKDFKDSKGKRFKAVQAKWKEMSNTLGQDNLVRRRLKVTYNELYADLQAAVAKAMETDPEQSLKDLEPLHKKIKEARSKAEEVDAQYKEFKAERDALIELHKTLTKETRTWITDKCEAYENKFKAQLAEAKLLAKTEGSLTEAFTALKKTREELEAIRSVRDPRGELQKKNGVAEQEQRLARDLARQFEAEKIAFDKVAEEAEAKVKEAAQDDGQVTRLRNAASGAAKIVEPYLNAISKWPHEKAKGQDSDPPERVISAFTQARKQIAELTAAARRLIENPASTEVADPGDLAKIEEEFRDRCRKLVGGVKELLAKVKSAAEKSDQWPGTEPKAPKKEVIEQTVTKLTDYFSDLHVRFSPKSLVRPLEVLKDRTTEQAARKAAREKAVREIRRMTQDLLRDDILKELRKNPYRKLTTETSLLRASLKSLELAVLVGV